MKSDKVSYTRSDVDGLAELADLDSLELNYDSIDESSCALLAYQRTKQISRKSRLSWEAGNSAPLLDEVRENKERIIKGAFLEIYREYLPLKEALKSQKLKSVCDIGCGQGINNVFLLQDFKPAFTLVDIEKTDDQYHNWAENGSGYASLVSAKALLVENGAKKSSISTTNPTKTKLRQKGRGFDLVTSLYSCGFHYPVDDYIELFSETIANGGSVCIDLRQRYMNRGSQALSRLYDLGEVIEIYRDIKSSRVMFRGKIPV